MDEQKARAQKIFAQAMQTYWRVCGFDPTTPLYEFVPRLSPLKKVGFLDFARSLATSGMANKETVALESGAALYCKPFQMVVTSLSPIVPPVDVVDGVIVYGKIPNWFGEGFVFPILDPKAIKRVRFVICIGDRPEEITRVNYDFFVD